MGREVTIKSERALEHAERVAQRRNISIEQAIEDALAAFDIETAHKEAKLRRWETLLLEDRKHLNDSDFAIEDLYDPETGLPA